VSDFLCDRLIYKCVWKHEYLKAGILFQVESKTRNQDCYCKVIAMNNDTEHMELDNDSIRLESSNNDQG
jgi:hypothetical protein